MPTPDATPPHAPEEPTLLTQFLAQSGGVCPACGYDLKGVHANACPECGTPLELVLGDQKRLLQSRVVPVAVVVCVVEGSSAMWGSISLISMTAGGFSPGVIYLVYQGISVAVALCLTIWAGITLLRARKARRRAMATGARTLPMRTSPWPLVIGVVTSRLVMPLLWRVLLPWF